MGMTDKLIKERIKKAELNIYDKRDYEALISCFKMGMRYSRYNLSVNEVNKLRKKVRDVNETVFECIKICSNCKITAGEKINKIYNLLIPLSPKK